MKIRALFALVGLVIGFAAPSLAQPTNPPDPQLRQWLGALFKQFDAAYKRNDAAAVAANFTEDAVGVSPHGPIFGRQAIEGWYAELFKGVKWPSHIPFNFYEIAGPSAICTKAGAVEP